MKIESRQNKRFKLLRRLLTAKGIRKEGKAIFSGRKIVPELLCNHREKIEACIVKTPNPPPGDLPGQVPVLSLRSTEFNEIDTVGTGGPLLVIRTGPLKKWEPRAEAGASLLIALQDPVNVGAMIRLSAAFGLKEAVILKEGAFPYLQRSLRASGPAVLKTPLFSGPALGELQTDPLPLVALSRDGIPLPGFNFPETFALVAGSEGPGIPSSLLCSCKISIPISEKVESLNAATAAAIALYVYRQQHPKGG